MTRQAKSVIFTHYVFRKLREPVVLQRVARSLFATNRQPTAIMALGKTVTTTVSKKKEKESQTYVCYNQGHSILLHISYFHFGHRKIFLWLVCTSWGTVHRICVYCSPASGSRGSSRWVRWCWLSEEEIVVPRKRRWGSPCELSCLSIVRYCQVLGCRLRER